MSPASMLNLDVANFNSDLAQIGYLFCSDQSPRIEICVGTKKLFWNNSNPSQIRK